MTEVSSSSSGYEHVFEADGTIPDGNNGDTLHRYLYWLTQRVSALEAELARLEASKLPNLRKVEYKIGRLYVRELSGTLNIGVTSIGEAMELTSLEEFPEGVAQHPLDADGFDGDADDRMDPDDEISW